VRRESPVATLGGGIVLDPDAERIRRTDSETLAWVSQLGSRDPAARASAALYFVGFRGWSPADLPRTAGVDSTDVVHGLLADRGRLAEIPLSPTRVFRLHRRILERLCDRIEAALRKLHDRFPLKSTLDRSLLNSGFRFLADPAILAAALEDMQAAGRVCLDSKGVALVGHGPRMSQNERRILAQILATYRAAGLETPSTAQCRQQMARGQESIPQLLKLAAENGDLVQVAPDFYLHADVERETRTLLEQRLAGGKGLTMSEIREILNTTRKYAVPLCEYFDRVGFTQRRGDVRFLAAAADHQE
jgi:selenocysteine-specific elongation factor